MPPCIKICHDFYNHRPNQTWTTFLCLHLTANRYKHVALLEMASLSTKVTRFLFLLICHTCSASQKLKKAQTPGWEMRLGKGGSVFLHTRQSIEQNKWCLHQRIFIFILEKRRETTIQCPNSPKAKPLSSNFFHRIWRERSGVNLLWAFDHITCTQYFAYFQRFWGGRGMEYAPQHHALNTHTE